VGYCHYFFMVVHKSWPKKDKSTNEKIKNKVNSPTTVEPLIKKEKEKGLVHKFSNLVTKNI